MRQGIFLLVSLMALTGCEGVMYAARNAVNSANREIIRASDTFNPQAKIDLPNDGSRYCYKGNNDIVCYRDPQPGAEERLVGYYEPPVSSEYSAPVTRTSSLQVDNLPPLANTTPPPSSTRKQEATTGPKLLITR